MCGKSVTVGMCWGTILSFYNLTGTNIEELDIKHLTPSDVTYLLLAAITSYYQSRDEEPPIRDTDLLYNAKPKELVEATIAAVSLYCEFYSVPKAESKPAKGEEEDGKN